MHVQEGVIGLSQFGKETIITGKQKIYVAVAEIESRNNFSFFLTPFLICP
ncbi:MAG: hypothetical protein KO464_05615 [Candidatus Methanofastidiosum sp.]|nr:hypothetical protein [Methanofastidiosum sp.]